MTNHVFQKVLPIMLVLTGLSATGAVAQDAGQGGSQDQSVAAQDGASSGQRSDGQIEMDVVHALDAVPALQQDWITAGTVQGEVTLTGTSASEANRQMAESTAGKIPGVTKVVNNLKVGDPQQAQNAAGPSDAQQDQDQGQQQAGNQAAMPPSASNGARPTYNPGQGAPGANQQYPSQQYPSQQYPNRQYPNQGYPGQNYPNQGYPNQGYQGQPGQGSYAPQPPLPPEGPRNPVTLVQGTLLKVRTSEPLDSKMAKDGAPVQYTVATDVYAGGVLAIPRGATIHGRVVDVKKAGALGGRPELGLQLDSLEMEGKSYPLAAEPLEVKGPNKAGRTAGSAFGGALFGALIGGAVGGGEGAAIGAAAGGVGGTAASAATPGPRVWIPSEALMNFHLNAPVVVTPVSRAEAQRLAGNQMSPAQRPTLYRRGYPYGYPPPPPPGYYRPY